MRSQSTTCSPSEVLGPFGDQAPAVAGLGGGAGWELQGDSIHICSPAPGEGEQEEEEGSEPHCCFLGQHRRDRHCVWLPCPQGAKYSLNLEAVPCSSQPHFCWPGSEAHIPAAGTTTQAGRLMLSAFIQLMQQSIQEKKKKK